MEAVIIALWNIVANPLRSFLTTIGIVVGIAAVIVVIAIGEGNQEVIQDKIKMMGANLLTITLQNTGFDEGKIVAGMPVFVGPKAIATLKGKISAIEAISPVLRIGSHFKHQSKSAQFLLNGTYSGYQTIRNFKVLSGRYFSAFEEKYKKRVCVLSKSAAKRLSIDGHKIPKQNIIIDGRKYTVIGIVNDLPPLQNNAKPEQAYIPYSVMKKEWPYLLLDTVYLTIYKEYEVEENIGRIKSVLEKIYGETSKNWVKGMTDILKSEKAIIMQTTLIITGVASLSLFVGGIGIMNIMLVTVKERTKEIGIRKAIGATDASILHQFLLEGVMLCILGGVVGTIFGIACAQVVADLMEIPVKISWSAIIVALVFSSGVGVFFSLYPAIYASKLSPVEALRYE
ncbi:MAG: FtsX-like permease family protein [Gammaproteobacteria bacterium]|nr:FtsX-like permease family protein [Gammaproteobacteria bacterium]